MRTGGENRKKMIMAGGLGAVALICLWKAYSAVFGGPTNPAITNAPAASARPAVRAANNSKSTSPNGTGTAAIPGVAAERVATTSASLDPTLDETAMLRTESLVYSGEGRNIFSAVYTPPPPAVVIPKQIISPRPAPMPVTQPIQTGPPPPPPINLKFFGIATRANGQRQAFLLQGEDVYLASTGDIVARKYKIGTILPGSVQVTDLQNNNTQNLPFIPQ